MELIVLLTDNPAIITTSNGSLISYLPLDTNNLAQAIIDRAMEIFPEYTPHRIKVIVKALPVANVSARAKHMSMELNKYIIHGYEGVTYLTREDINVLNQLEAKLGKLDIEITDAMSLYGLLYKTSTIVVDSVGEYYTVVAVSDRMIKDMMISNEQSLVAKIREMKTKTGINNVVCFETDIPSNYNISTLINVQPLFRASDLPSTVTVNLILADVLGVANMKLLSDDNIIKVDPSAMSSGSVVRTLEEEDDYEEQKQNHKKKKKFLFF